ncbi:MAG: response regulator [Inhella sp.]
MEGLRFLFVDDEPHILQAVLRQVRHHFRAWSPRIQADVESDPRRAIELIRSRPYAVVVSDYRMPGLTGVEVLSEARQCLPTAARVMLSGQVDRDGLAAAINAAQVHRFLVKPWCDAELMAALEAGLAHHQTECQQALSTAPPSAPPGAAQQQAAGGSDPDANRPPA